MATPIGNLGDMTPRAIEVLNEVAVIAAEDTRHSAKLLSHFGVSTRCVACHEHNEQQVSGKLISRMEQGESVALISDAGTPLVSDPGFHLVRQACRAGIDVVPIPGASAMIAALSVSGLPSDRFVFEGFLPAKEGARRKRLEAVVDEPRTLIFYESPHRIVKALKDIEEVLDDPTVVCARELTKKFEEVKKNKASELVKVFENKKPKGEFVILINSRI